MLAGFELRAALRSGFMVSGNGPGLLVHTTRSFGTGVPLFQAGCRVKEHFSLRGGIEAEKDAPSGRRFRKDFALKRLFDRVSRTVEDARNRI